MKTRHERSDHQQQCFVFILRRYLFISCSLSTYFHCRISKLISTALIIHCKNSPELRITICDSFLSIDVRAWCTWSCYTCINFLGKNKNDLFEMLLWALAQNNHAMPNSKTILEWGLLPRKEKERNKLLT